MRDTFRSAQATRLRDTEEHALLSQVLLRMNTDFSIHEATLFATIRTGMREKKLQTRFSTEELTQIAKTWATHETLRDLWNERCEEFAAMRTDITKNRDAATYVRTALKLQDTYAVFLRESGTWKANAQKQLRVVDGLVHDHISTSFLGAFWSGDDFVPWLVVNHDKRPPPLAEYREALLNGTFTYEAYSHIYLSTVVTLRKHGQLSHVVNCLVSRYMEAEVFQ